MPKRRNTISAIWSRLRAWLLPETAIRAILALETLTALWAQNWSAAFVALATLAATFLPRLVARRWQVHVPVAISSTVVIFIFATLFMGEVWDYYGRFWWWDLLLHGGSATGFGLIGFLFIFLMFQGNKHTAPPLSVAFFSFCFGLSIGAIWEVFEYGMDTAFGLNMQRSGLDDTMHDLVVDMAGAAIGALAGYLYLRGQAYGWLQRLIEESVRRNRRLFRRNR